MNKIVITSGYMGSGSSAITELVSEIESFKQLYDEYDSRKQVMRRILGRGICIAENIEGDYARAVCLCD